MLEEIQSMIFTPEIDRLEAQLEELQHQMDLLAKQGKYVLAENLRQNIEKLKKDLEAKRKETLNKRHKEEGKQVKRYLREDLQVFHKEWENIIKQHQEKGVTLKKALEEKHKKAWQDEKQKLQLQLPLVGKESAELLNLRKIEENLAKQQNFVEAHLVQQQVHDLYKKQEKLWQKNKQDRIQTELSALKNKQKIQMQALQKKHDSEAAELELQRTKAEAQLTLKHSVMKKGLQSQTKKENLMASGVMKSKVDVVSPSRSILSPSKSRMLSSSSSWKMLPSMTR